MIEELSLAPGDPAWDEALGLLQAGFAVRSALGLSARAFMRETLWFEDGYIEGAVSTVFIDAKPVDDIDAAVVAEGSLIALSAAMPGLVGAVMRRRSPYASFREAISYSPGASPRPSPGGGREGLIRVKFFNAVMRDRGRETLGRGIFVTGRQAERILAERRPPDELVFLRVIATTEAA